MLCMKVCKELMELIEKGNNTHSLDDIVTPKDLAKCDVNRWMVQNTTWVNDAHMMKDVCKKMQDVWLLMQESKNSKFILLTFCNRMIKQEE